MRHKVIKSSRRTGATAVQTVEPLVAVIRRCQVCEWEGELIETVGANPDCPWCHGPTERKATLATSTVIASGAKNPHAAALGRLGGVKGGRARAEALTATQRRRIASRAARARWGKRKDEK
jgi:pyruvate-formate lyase-activating enzyme